MPRVYRRDFKVHKRDRKVSLAVLARRRRKKSYISSARILAGYGRFRNYRTGGFMGMELKFYDTGITGASLTAPADATAGLKNPSATIALNTVVQGDGEQQRDGRRMTMKSIFVSGTIKVPAKTSESTGDDGALIFIALVLDTQANGAVLASENVFVNPAGNTILAANPMRNLQFIKRFRVLGTKSIHINSPAIANDTGATGGIIQQGVVRKWSFFKNLDMQTTFSGTTENIANITDNSLSIVAWTSDIDMAPLISYSSRLRFMG